MSKFAPREIEAIKGSRQKFYELLIDGVSQYKNFLDEIDSNAQYKSEAKRVLSFMNLVACGTSLTEKQIKNITPKGDSFAEYEFRTKHLRVYAFQLSGTGKIVVYWTLKNPAQQQNDINKFRSIKIRYLKALNFIS